MLESVTVCCKSAISIISRDFTENKSEDMSYSCRLKLFALIGRIGADPDDSDELRLQKMLMVSGAMMIIMAAIIWGLMYYAFDEWLAGSIPIGYAVISFFSIILFAVTRRYHLFRISQYLLMLLLPWLLMIFLGGFINSSAVILWSLLCPVGVLLFDEPEQAPRWFIAFLVLVILSGLLQPYVRVSNNLPSELVLAFFILNLGAVSSIIFVLLYYFVHQRNTLRERSESLLLNILPEKIAAALKVEPRTIAHNYSDASILFADIVNFTPLSALMSPAELVELLNEVFSYIDGRVDKYGLEKIKTIGDCYMVAAGVPDPRPDHAQVLTRLALDIQAYVNEHDFGGQRLSFRIGINSGPLVAGVIGTRKFSYDLWGDTVNTASRMESQGTEGAIQITRATYNLIREDFICEAVGTIAVKGKGGMEVWRVMG